MTRLDPIIPATLLSKGLAARICVLEEDLYHNLEFIIARRESQMLAVFKSLIHNIFFYEQTLLEVVINLQQIDYRKVGDGTLDWQWRPVRG